MTIQHEALAREIEKQLRCYQALVRAEADARLQPAQWMFSRDALHWHVAFTEEVLEPDLDIEVTTGACIIRARSAIPPARTLLCVLPVPDEFDASRAEIRFALDSLEIRIERNQGR